MTASIFVKLFTIAMATPFYLKFIKKAKGLAILASTLASLAHLMKATIKK